MKKSEQQKQASPDDIEYVDAHCHVDLFANPKSLTADACDQRVHTIAVTNAPFVFAHTQELARERPYIYAALGLHPELVATHGHQVARFPALLPATRFIGEVGLDYTTRDISVRQQQRQVFETVLDLCAAASDKVISVHSRRAADDTVAMVGPGYPGTVILHWFSGSHRALRAATHAGLLFSVNSAMLSSESGRRLVAEMPRERVLTESDGPFVGARSNPESPCSMTNTVQLLARVWKISAGETAAVVARNYRDKILSLTD